MEVVNFTGGSLVGDYDRAREVEEFERTKAGVKGLVDSGILKIPKFFIHPPDNLHRSRCFGGLNIPVIDSEGFESGGQQRKKIVDGISKACETWGFFQMVNHDVPADVMDKLLKGARAFHEQPAEVKMDLYTRDKTHPVRYCNNEYIHTCKAATWRDALSVLYKDGDIDPNLIPAVCRKEVEEYMKCMFKLKEKISELLSESLELTGDYVSSTECMASASFLCNYYPPCPEPNLTLGLAKHTDRPFLTILLQDSIAGLQVLYENRWVDVPHIPGALIINVGDFMQLITNDKFKSVEHRVLAGSEGPRISAACFFFPSTRNMSKPYGPIKDILSNTNPPRYKAAPFLEVSGAESRNHGPDGYISILEHLKLT